MKYLKEFIIGSSFPIFFLFFLYLLMKLFKKKNKQILNIWNILKKSHLPSHFGIKYQIIVIIHITVILYPLHSTSEL